MQSTNALHQQHVNCLINTWLFAVKTWLLIACDKAFYAIICVPSVLQEDSAQWQQDLESVHLSCDESLDIGSPSAESTPVEIHYSSVRKARKSHPEDTGSCSSSLEYLGLVTQTSGVRPNKSSSDVAMGLEKKVGTDSLSEGVDEPDSQIKSDSSPSILNPIESRTNSEFKSVNQTEVQNIHLQSTLEPIVKVEVDEIREEATKQNSVLNNSECLSISCTRQLELNVNVSSSNSVISPSPEAEVSTFAPSAISGIVCGLTSQRIRKTQAVNSLCNQLVSTADETGNEHYLTALEVSIECQNLSETEPVKETARITRSKTRTWQDDDDIDKTHQADDSQQGQSCSKTKGVDNSSPLHDNAIHRTNVTVNRVVEATEDSLIRDNLQSSENEPNQNLEASLQSTSDKSLILEYYIKGQSPQKKINKDCLVERANSFMENFKVSNSSQADNRNTARSDMTDLRRKHEGSMLNIKRRSPRLSGKVNVDNTQVISNDKGKEKTSKQGKELMTDSSNEESLSEDEINNNEVSSENFSFRELASSEDSSCSEDEQLHAIVKNAEQIHISDIDAAKSSAVLSKNVPQTPDRSSKSEKRRQTNHCTQDKSLQSNKSDTSSCKNKHSDGTKNHTNDISDKAIISGCGPQDLAFSEIDRHRPIGCEKVDNNLRKIGDISMKKSSGSNNEKILDTEQSNLSLQKTPNNKVLGDKIVSNSVETGKCLNGKTNSPLQISASEDGLDNLTSEKVHAFRDPSSSREMNSDESLETEGTPDLLGGTQPFQIEHLKQKSPTETPLPDILTGTQGFNTAYSETQGFVPDLSGSLRSLSSSSNEQSSLNSSGENRGDNAKSLTQGFVPVLFSSSRSLSHSSNETSLLNSSDEKRVNQLISPDSVLERPRLNRKSKMHVRSTNSVVNNVSNQYSAELKAEELRLENLTKPCNSNVTGQFVSETVESLNITEKTSDRLVNKNQDMIIISSGSSIEEFTETEVKKKDNYKMNRAEKINSDLSERSILHKNGQDNIQTSDFNESDNTVIEPPAINSSSEGLDGNIQIQVDSLKQLLSGVRVQPVNRVIRGHSKYTGKRRKNREKDKNEPKGNVLRVKPVNNINRKGQSKQSVSGNFINLIDTESESEPEIHFDKNTKMKTYEPEKVVIDGRTFENKKKWMNFVESPFPPPRKSARKSFRIDIFDNQEKTAAVNSTAGSVGRYGLVYKKVDGVYHFDRESKEGTQYNRTSTNSTHKSSKHVAPDVKIVDTSSQSIDNLEEQQKDTNGLNNEENVSDSSSNWALKCSLGNSLNENENFTAYKQDKKIDTRHTPNNSNGKNGNKMNNKENVSKGRLNADLECSSSNSLNENENLKDCQTNANNIPKSLKPIVELRKVDQMCHSIDTLVGQEQGGSIKELNNKENISEGCSNAAVKSSLGNSLKEREILNLTTETSLFSKSNSEATRNSKTVCRKRKLNADGDGKSCKVQRLTDVAQNIKTFTGLSREMRQANITAFFKNTERKSKYMQGLDLRNSLTQEWIDKQIFEGDSENNNSHLEGMYIIVM